MNNSTRNLKMKKLLIATTALVATAGMASADITISGHAAAGVYSGLDTKAASSAAYQGLKLKSSGGAASTTAATQTSNGTLTLGTMTAPTAMAATATAGANFSDAAGELAALNAVLDAKRILAAKLASSSSIGSTDAAFAIAVAGYEADVAEREAEYAIIKSRAAVAKTYSADGIYSNAGVDFTMTGATDNGISFSASVNIDAGMEIDAGDFELDGKDGGTAGLGAVSMTGAFGTVTFDDGGIENLYSDGLSNADVSYATTIGAVSLTVAHDTAAASTGANSVSAGYTASGMAFTLTASEAAAGTSASLAMSYALNDTVTITADTDQVAGAESVQTIGAKTTLNGVSVSVESANNSTWDVDLGYTAGGFALTYGVDETDGWTASATSALGGGATFAAGVNSEDSMYAGVSFAF
jgi:outer membrane protein OmpU